MARLQLLHAPALPTDDKVATIASGTTTGAITSADTFKGWFSDIPGENMSGAAPLDLVREGNKWVFDDTTDPHYSQLEGFYPAYGRLFGTPGHNEQFTFQFQTNFTYSAAMDQYFRALSDAEIWVFIDGKLALDMGGFHGMMDQRIDLSRLCLNDGQTYNFSFFLANRCAPQGKLRLETNILFDGSPRPVTVFAPVD